MITDPFFYVVAIPAVFLVGLSKGGFGGTAALAGVPLMALAISPVAAAGILLPIMIVMDAISLVAWRGRFDRKVIATMLPAAILGIAIGYFAASAISAEGFRITLGVLALWFFSTWFFGAGRNQPPKAQNTVKAGFWGSVAGFSSFVSHAGGPPYQIYVVPLRLEPATYAGTSVVFFAVVNAIKLVPYFLLGQFSSQNLSTSATLLPLAFVATLSGVWLVKRVETELFYRIVYWLLVPIGLKLIYDGAAALL
ncbi:sulfite exporter TauE/SafE family protein [Jiella marina]|uniref:sulfite exporter TauE/SafE family protein n=1 Tax=Jiella sp. LLJ827 TaxID=2917712 RepID=UPI0021014A53|nr:sulfite exporter TauE/SafE family protein [Jiella sp. LLJ827]